MQLTMEGVLQQQHQQTATKHDTPLGKYLLATPHSPLVVWLLLVTCANACSTTQHSPATSGNVCPRLACWLIQRRRRGWLELWVSWRVEGEGRWVRKGLKGRVEGEGRQSRRAGPLWQGSSLLQITGQQQQQHQRQQRKKMKLQRRLWQQEIILRLLTGEELWRRWGIKGGK